MRIKVVLACAAVLAGCAREAPDRVAAPDPHATETPRSAEPASLEPLPARYTGVLPCADCSGIRYEIDLRPANVYFLRMTYLGVTPQRSDDERSYDDIGAWSIASDLHTLALRSSRQSPSLFSIESPTTLLRLDIEGQPIESELNYALQRVESYEPLSPQVPLRGMYSKDDAGAIIEECTTGLKLRVQEGSAAEIEAQYDRLRKNEKRPLLLAAEGRIEVSGPEHAGLLTGISTARFWPGESCGARGVTHDLEGSRWVLVRIGGESFVPQEGRPEPYIVLQSSTKQIAGHGGCNRLSGGYRIEGSTLEFGELTTTRMSCPDLDTEYAFLNALDNVARWRLMDNQLVLLDKNNAPLLQLESRNL
jgi:copper homeostasis protein (lipoprotein)